MDMTQTTELLPTQPGGALLGLSSFTSGNVVLLGAPSETENAVLACLKPRTAWFNTSKFSAKVTNSEPGSNFGYSVSMSGLAGVVGSPNENPARRSAYMFASQCYPEGSRRKDV